MRYNVPSAGALSLAAVRAKLLRELKALSEFLVASTGAKHIL
jgi:hypothetical protein